VVDGETVMLAPVATEVPPQLPLYHLQLAPVPKVPPVIERAVVVPWQIVVFPVTEAAGTEVS
jgi:hypothetical protein